LGGETWRSRGGNERCRGCRQENGNHQKENIERENASPNKGEKSIGKKVKRLLATPQSLESKTTSGTDDQPKRTKKVSDGPAGATMGRTSRREGVVKGGKGQGPGTSAQRERNRNRTHKEFRRLIKVTYVARGGERGCKTLGRTRGVKKRKRGSQNRGQGSHHVVTKKAIRNEARSGASKKNKKKREGEDVGSLGICDKHGRPEGSEGGLPGAG